MTISPTGTPSHDESVIAKGERLHRTRTSTKGRPYRPRATSTTREKSHLTKHEKPHIHPSKSRKTESRHANALRPPLLPQVALPPSPGSSPTDRLAHRQASVLLVVSDVNVLVVIIARVLIVVVALARQERSSSSSSGLTRRTPLRSAASGVGDSRRPTGDALDRVELGERGETRGATARGGERERRDGRRWSETVREGRSRQGRRRHCQGRGLLASRDSRHGRARSGRPRRRDRLRSRDAVAVTVLVRRRRGRFSRRRPRRHPRRSSARHPRRRGSPTRRRRREELLLLLTRRGRLGLGWRNRSGSFVVGFCRVFVLFARTSRLDNGGRVDGR